LPNPKKTPATVEEVVSHFNECKTVIMKPFRYCPRFQPGQFLHFAIDEYDPSSHWPESRVFSIASSPLNRSQIRITFSVKGNFTRRMYNEIKVGDTVWIKLPYGDFRFSEDKDMVFIAGGTGITPFISYLEYKLEKPELNKIKMYYGVRELDYLLYEDLLDKCMKSANNFSYTIYAEELTDSQKSILKGFIPIENIAQANISSDALIYLSGPPQMIHSFIKILELQGIDKQRIIVDSWE